MMTKSIRSRERHVPDGLWAFLLLVTVVMVGLGYGYFRYAGKNYHLEVDRQLSTIADLKGSQIEQWREDRIEDAELFFANPAFSTLVRDFFDRPEDSGVEKTIRAWMIATEDHCHDIRLFLLDTGGAERMTVQSSPENISSTVSRRVPEALQSDQIIFQDFYRDEHDHRTYLATLVPLYDQAAGHRPLGVLVLRIDPEKYLYPFVKTWPTPSESAETLLVRREGNDAVFLNALKFRQDAALNLRVPLEKTEDMAVKAVLGHQDIYDGADYRGVSVIAALRAIPNSPWFMVARMDRTEAYAPLRRSLWLLGTLIGTLYIAAAVGSVSAWRLRGARFYRERYEAAEKLRESYRELEIRNKLDHVFLTHSDEKMYGEALQVVLEALESKHGTFGYIDEAGAYVRASMTPDIQGQDESPDTVRVISRESWDGIWGQALHEGTTVCLNEAFTVSEGRPPLANVLDVPIVFQDKIIGNVLIGDKAAPYTDSDVRLLETLAREIAPVLKARLDKDRNERERKLAEDALKDSRLAALSLLQDTQVQKKRAEEALERAIAAERESTQRAQWAEGLQKAGQRLASCLTVEEVAECAAHAPVDYLHMKMAWVALSEKDGGTRAVAWSSPDIKEVARDSPCAQEVFGVCEPIVVPDTLSAPRFGAACVARARKHGFRRCGTFPIMSGDRCVAVLTVRDMGAMEASCLVGARALLEVFCRQAGHVWQRCLDEEEKRKLAQAIEASPATVVVTDSEGNIEYVNPKFTETTGYTQEEILGVNPRILKSGVQPDRIYKEMWDTLLSGQEWRGELCNRKKNGELYWEHASISPIRDVRGKISHYIAVKEDVTESKRMMEELVEAKTEAERANRAKSAFLASMSHEIRTPMNAILGYAQLMQRDPAVTTQQCKYLDTISHSGEHLLALINEILEMSKIEAGKITLNLATFDLPRLLDDMEMMFRARTEAKGLRLEKHLSDTLPRYVCTDEGKVRQVLINMLANAVKFSDAGGIAVRARGAQLDSGRVRIAIEVEDSGCGIAPEELERVFTPFDQTKSGQTRGGTGLGMSISQQHARLMGGDLTVTSALDEGSVFRFEFEAGTGVEGDVNACSVEHVVGLAHGQAPVRVLVVDDLPENRYLLARLLTEVGFLIREAQNGVEAIAAFEEWHPKVILMDLRMPKMDGCEAAQRIRVMPGGAETHVIAVSASAMEEDRTLVLGEDFDGFIRKPFREQEIFEALQQCTGVEYIFASQAASDLAPAVARVSVSREAIRALPEGLAARMCDAITAARMNTFQELATKAGAHDPAAGEALLALARRYEYDALLELLSDKND